MSVQKAIFPGLILGICFLIGLTSLIKGTNLGGINRTGGKVEVAASQANVKAPAAQGCSISSAYPESVRQWCAFIDRYARENGLDPNLISAVMLNESAGQPDAYSRSGAVGLLQVMPRDGKAAEFMCPAGPCFASRPSSAELFDPEYNISYGSRLLADLVQRYGDLREALKAYGPKDVGYYYADLILGTLNSHP